MIAFGVAVSDRTTYREVALPGIERAAEPDSLLLERFGLPIRRAYNEIMDDAACLPRLEALVLLHQDLELTDASLPRRARALFRDPAVGMGGPLGATELTLHLWQERRRLHGTVNALGVERSFGAGEVDLEALDGALLLLAPWAVRALRFGDSATGGFHGYDVEIGLRVRAHGGRLRRADVPYFHHRPAKHDYEAQRLAALAVAHDWDPALRPEEWVPAFRA